MQTYYRHYPIGIAQSINEWRVDTLNKALAGLGHRDRQPSSLQAMGHGVRDFVGQRVERYCVLAQLSRSTLRAAATPSTDVAILPDREFKTRGQLPGSVF